MPNLLVEFRARTRGRDRCRGRDRSNFQLFSTTLKEEYVLISAKQRLHRIASMLSKLIVAGSVTATATVTTTDTGTGISPVNLA